MGDNPLVKKEYTLNGDWPLSPEQNDGVRFLLTKFNAILAFQAGFGKTYTSLTAAQHILNFRKDFICIVICPKAANSIFKKEISEKIKMSYSMQTANEKTDVKGSRYVIFNPTKLDLLKTYLLRLDKKVHIVVVIDEAHWLQNKKTYQSKIMWDLRGRFKCVFALTATPVLNHLEGMFNVVNYVKPGFFPSWNRFKNNYMITKVRMMRRGGRMIKFDEVVGYKNTEALAKLLESVSIIRRKTYNLKFFYLKTEMDVEETRNYRIASEGILDSLYRESSTKEKDFGPRLHDLQRIVDGSHELTKTTTANNKEKELVRCLREILDKEESVLIYAEYESTYSRLSKLLNVAKNRKILNIDRIYMITGKVKIKERVEVERNLSKKSIVIITRAGSQSINLKNANNVIFYDIPFSVGTFIQVLGRITRMDGTYEFQNIYLLEVDGTIDTYKRMLIQDHADLIKKLFGEESNLPEVRQIDRKFMNKLKKKMLWNYRPKKGA